MDYETITDKIDETVNIVPDRGIKNKVIKIGILIIGIAVIIAFVLSFVGKKSGRLSLYSIPSDSVIDMQPCAGKTVILTQNKTVYINSSAQGSTGSSFSFSNPVMRINNGNVLVFDRSSTRYNLERNGKLYYNASVTGNIVTAAVGSDGSVAYSIDAEYDSFLQTSIYFRKNKTSEPVLIYKEQADYCVALAVSDNSAFVAAAFIDAVNAENIIRISVIDTETLEVSDFTPFESNSVLYGIDYTSDGEISLIHEKGITRIAKGGTVTNFFETDVSSLLSCNISSEGITALNTSTDGNKYHPTVYQFSESGSSLDSFECDNEINAVSCSDKYTAVAMGRNVYVYNRNGIAVARVVSSESSDKLCAVGGHLYILQSDGIYVAGFAVPDDGDEPITVGGTAFGDTGDNHSEKDDNEDVTEKKIKKSEIITELTLPDKEDDEIKNDTDTAAAEN